MGQWRASKTRYCICTHVGSHFEKDSGLWYRGIPIRQNVNDNISHDAVVVILGFQMPRVEATYSYDFTVSELGATSGGTHEVALKYKLAIQMRARMNKKDKKLIPCPTFNH